MGKQITCTVYVPSSDGSYRNYDGLSEADKLIVSDKLVGRLGKTLNDWYNTHDSKTGG